MQVTATAAAGSMASALAHGLRERAPEIEAAILTRASSISDPGEVGDPAYVAGLRSAVGVGLEHALAVIEAPRFREAAPVPAELLAQARHAARSGIGLDTVLRRYIAAHTLLGDYLVAEAERVSPPVGGEELKCLQRRQATLLDRLVAAASDAYLDAYREGASHRPGERRARQVRMLLAGELLDAEELDYDLDAWHVGAIAVGPGAHGALREIAAALNRRLLAVCAREGELWAWLGGRERIDSREVLEASRDWPSAGSLALGEPGRGVQGWRVTHRQAQAAMNVVRLDSCRTAAYGEVTLLAAALGDEVLAGSLREIYLAPLERERDGGAALRETLLAYLATRLNASSTAAVLGVSRNTVGVRLRSVEAKIGRPVDSCVAELQTALRLQELGGGSSTSSQGLAAG